MAATRRRRFAQKLHSADPAPALTRWIVAMGVLAVWSRPDMTARARLVQLSQMYACGPAISFLTCF
jgi:hypothetical protein